MLEQDLQRVFLRCSEGLGEGVGEGVFVGHFRFPAPRVRRNCSAPDYRRKTRWRERPRLPPAQAGGRSLRPRQPATHQLFPDKVAPRGRSIPPGGIAPDMFEQSVGIGGAAARAFGDYMVERGCTGVTSPRQPHRHSVPATRATPTLCPVQPPQPQFVSHAVPSTPIIANRVSRVMLFPLPPPSGEPPSPR